MCFNSTVSVSLPSGATLLSMSDPMTKAVAKPLFHVSLGDRDEWVIEAEWPDGTLERVTTFRNHSAAVHWIATTSEAWLHSPVLTAPPTLVA
jgi:hypothetical protein